VELEVVAAAEELELWEAVRQWRLAATLESGSKRKSTRAAF
jgi:hypothetical protein